MTHRAYPVPPAGSTRAQEQRVPCPLGAQSLASGAEKQAGNSRSVTISATVQGVQGARGILRKGHRFRLGVGLPSRGK